MLAVELILPSLARVIVELVATEHSVGIAVPGSTRVVASATVGCSSRPPRLQQAGMPLVPRHRSLRLPRL